MHLNSEVEITKAQQAASSCVGALITSICTTPLDVVKVRLQAQNLTSPSKFDPFKRTTFHPTILPDGSCLCSHCSKVPQRHKLACLHTKAYSGGLLFESRNMLKISVDTMKNIVNIEGTRRLWSGLSPALLMSIPGTVIYFGMYDNLKVKLGYKPHDVNNIYIPVVAGIASRVTAVVLVNPLELVRTKMQSTNLSYRQIYEATKISLKVEGLRFMFRGLVPTLLRDVPFSAIYWCGYECSKIYHYQLTGQITPPFWLTFLAGGLAGTVAAILTSPFDVVKTRLQIELGRTHSDKSRSASTLAVAKKLYRTSGWQALYAGIIPRIIKIAPACAIMISTYETGKWFFREYNIKKLHANY